MAQSTISEHLRLLRQADLLTGARDGPRTWYCMRRVVLRQIAAAILDLTATSSRSEAGG
ncbi:MAG: ArsR family transcriptional regulator [Acidobacteria bacterium]|nr:ArsR family transcriptional regulator [Acidobacteriota bacterium]